MRNTTDNPANVQSPLMVRAALFNLLIVWCEKSRTDTLKSLGPKQDPGHSTICFALESAGAQNL